MEALFERQNELVQSMQQLFTNFKKDGPSRRTNEYIKKRISLLDSQWNEFQNNHGSICAYKDKSFEYFINGVHERTLAFYNESRLYMQGFLVEEDSEVFVEAAQNTEKSKGSTSNNQTYKSSGGNSKTDELIRKQFSNFRAFERTIMGIDLDTVTERWELEDMLRSLQSRWSAIDSLHWEIDSESEGCNTAYETIFSNHERTFTSIKKAINKKLWSASHTGKVTPTMEIPFFHGNYHQWVSFKDIFTETIHNNTSLSRAQKMQFLKSKVKGEAERLIQHLHISSDNYETCWDLLNNRFNNKKLIFSSHINILLSIPTANQPSLNNIKKIHDTTLECLNAVKNLGVDTTNWDPLIVHLLSQKLDAETYNDYVESLKQPKEIPNLQDFISFLNNKFIAMESSSRKQICYENQGHRNYPQTSSRLIPLRQNIKTTYTNTPIISQSVGANKINTKKYKCAICKSNEHGIYYCPTFLNMTPERRIKAVTDHNLCNNCLYEHRYQECNSNHKCRECNSTHNTLLHEVFPRNQTPYANRGGAVQTPMNNTAHNKSKRMGTYVVQQGTISEVLLGTAMIKVEGADGAHHVMRALVDPGSQTSIITNSAAKKLSLSRRKCKGVVRGMGTSENNCKGVLTIKCKALYSDFEFITDILIMQKLINNLPSQSFTKPSWAHLHKLQLADPQFYESRPIDMLLDADIYSYIILEGISRATDTSLPIAQQTKLGWILSGSSKTLQCNVVLNNTDDIQRFWNLEEISEEKTGYQDQDDCIQFYKNTTQRLQDGRYQVRLPLKPNFEQCLGNSKSVAVAQFRSLERKLNKENNIAQDYKQFINEYLHLGHMKLCVSNSKPDYYMPHHCVIREESTTTSLRVVFNASSKTSSGFSLNDLMETGPNLQQDLQSLIIKWRQYKIAFAADIKKFFRQIWLHQDDQKLQKIIWRNSPQEPIREYQLLTVTYGTKAAPFLCMMTLRQLAHDEQKNYPNNEVLKVIQESFYTDDLLSGGHNVLSAQILQRDLINILQSAGLTLRKWKSNSIYLLNENNINEDEINQFNFTDSETSKTLGLIWNPKKDIFTFKSNLQTTIIKHTKRTLLSEISKVFDPLGWLTPLTTKYKILFQKTWQANLQWDSELPNDLLREWITLRTDMFKIEQVEIPRWLQIQENDELEMHGFCDASLRAFSCVIYCRIKRGENYSVELVAGKARITPSNKGISTPRLELCGAQLLSRLMGKVVKCLSNYKIKVYGWVDSMAVLGWLQGDISRWKPYVANRLNIIKGEMPSSCWNYVRSTENPADCASRGIMVKQLQENQLWWKGPEWLLTYNGINQNTRYETNQEIRQVTVVLAPANQDNILHNILEKYSSLNTAVRVLAWVYRFISIKKSNLPYLSLSEIQKSRRILIKYIQHNHFESEILAIKQNKPINSKSKISSLLPYLDKEGILRVRGRLRNANISYDMKHPIIIPRESRLTELLIMHAHELSFHGGVRLTHNFIRQHYWIVGGNQVIKKRLRRCITCRRNRPELMQQLMGDLPESRSNISRPFYHTGVDFTGHFFIKSSKGRGIKTSKGYVAVFVCMATKAAHFELVSDLTTPSFLAALRRMIARRGKPAYMYSDNGRNFVGANKVLYQEYQEILNTFGEDFSKEMTDLEIIWKFNVVSFPSSGGLWEKLVGSLKYHLKRVVGEQKLTFEEFSTVLAQLEACLNSRPLYPMSDDPESSLDCLTPSHFLSSGPILNIVETENDLRTRWHLTQTIVKDVWKRWQSEYLSLLVSRSKWTKTYDNIKNNDVVIIHEPNLPPGKWAMGRVVDLHPGADGLVRVVSLKTKSGIIKRPIIKLSPLPVHDQTHNTSVNNQNSQSSETKDTDHQNIKEVRRPQRVNFITLVILLMTFVFNSSQAAFNITQFSEDKSLYFDKKGDLSLIRDEWKIVTYFKMEPYWKGIETLEKYIKYLSTKCTSSKGQSQCDVVMTQLQHEYSELQYYNQLLLSQHSSGRPRQDRLRRRRGLINGVGYLANSLFGILDERNARQYQRDILYLKYHQKHLETLTQSQTSLIESEFNLLKRNQENIEKQQEMTRIIFQKIDKNMQVINETLMNLSDSNDFSMVAITATNLAQNLKSTQTTLIDTVTDIYHGRFNFHLMTPDQLKDELNKISGTLPTELSLPIPNIQQDFTRLYQLFRIKVRMMEEYLLFEIKLPLISRDNFELFEIIPIPKQEAQTCISIVPIASKVAVNLKKSLYIPITTLEIQTCIMQDGDHFYCKFNNPVYNFDQDTSFCTHRESAKSLCETVIEPCKNNWKQLQHINTYFYFCYQGCQIRVICDDQASSSELSKAGIITMSSGCIMKQQELTNITHRDEQSSLTVTPYLYVPKLAPINHFINISLSEIMDRKDLHQQQHDENQTLLNMKIKDQIKSLHSISEVNNEVEWSNHDVHHYVMIYVMCAVGCCCAVAGWWRRRRSGRARQPAAAAGTSDAPAPSPSVQYQVFSVSDQCEGSVSVDTNSVRQASQRNAKLLTTQC